MQAKFAMLLYNQTFKINKITPIDHHLLAIEIDEEANKNPHILKPRLYSR
jgi:hypothetical protein